eukprot:comp23407_c0_seq1/m.38866 comp23407_c0_seq1/g.38866  ORF comp23407_c0_seq1/g.38866 comp23407_c0_seq1/m.38866 type:complete len:824 (-) comp23407_c0_seq1:551-3022(-)
MALLSTLWAALPLRATVTAHTAKVASLRLFSSTGSNPPSDLEERFKRAVAFLQRKTEAVPPSMQTAALAQEVPRALALYSYYKVATEGPCNTPAPSVFKLRDRAKWDAWKKLGQMSKEEAMSKYLALLTSRLPDWEDAVAPAPVLKAATNYAKLPDIHPRGYLFTGASGFIGKFLMGNLLKRDAPVYSLMRPQSAEKFRSMAHQRYGDAASKLVLMDGDISKPNFGLSTADFEVLKSKVDHVFHLAAIYDMTAPEEANTAANIDGTKHAVDVANQFGATLHYFSSVAVAGQYQGTYLESMYDEGQAFDNPYAKTKFIAEGIVRNEAKVPYRIYRPGLVIGSSETGEADKVDGPYYFFRTLQLMRKYLPGVAIVPFIKGARFPIVPVNYVADAVDYIAHKPKLDNKCFHLVDPNPLSMCDTLNEFARAAHAPQLSHRLADAIIPMLPPKVWDIAESLPRLQRLPLEALGTYLGIPASVVRYLNWNVLFDDSRSRRVLDSSGITVPPLRSYAWRVWDYYERYMDPAIHMNDRLRAHLKGKIVMVTGASDGIGRQMSVKLGSLGATVLLVSRTKEKLDAVKAEVEAGGGTGYVYATDLSKLEDIDGMVDKVLKDHGRVDILFNNAGRSIRRSVQFQYDRMHDFQRTMQLNYFGSVKLILRLLPTMRERKYGHVIAISSIGCQSKAPRFAAYVASKAALDGFTMCLAGEVADDGVIFSTVYMPLVRTKMIAPSKVYNDVPAMDVKDAADMALRCIVTKERKVSSQLGQLAELLGAVSPQLLEEISRRLYKMLPENTPEGYEGLEPTHDQDLADEARAVLSLLRDLHL